MIISRSTHVAAGSIVSFFLWLNSSLLIYTHTETHTNTHRYMYIPHIFLIYLSIDGHLNSFHVLTNVRTAAVNTGVHVFF